MSTLAMNAYGGAERRAASAGEEDGRELVEEEGFAHCRTTGGLQETTRRLVLGIAGEKDDVLCRVRRDLVQLSIEQVPRHVGHAEVEQNRVVVALRNERERLAATRDRVDRVPLRAEIGRYRAANGRLIVHDEHPLRLPGAAWRVWDVRQLDVRRRHERELDDEARAGHRANFRTDATSVLAHDPVGDGQSEPGAFANGLRREERIEDLREMLRCDPGTSVGDAQHEHLSALAAEPAEI